MQTRLPTLRFVLALSTRCRNVRSIPASSASFSCVTRRCLRCCLILAAMYRRNVAVRSDCGTTPQSPEGDLHITA